MQTAAERATMNALVYRGAGNKAIEERPLPQLETPGDAIVRIVKTTICGTDLHILKGDVPEVTPGRILGHEGIGVVEKTGSAVTQIRPGERVLISCISSCAKCEYCRKGMYSHCANGGWILGHLIDGTQAGYVRIPHADTSLYRLPAELDDDAAVMLSDILPTAFECGVLNGRVKPGDAVAIIGSGPIGLAAVLTSQLYSPAQIIVADVDGHRLQAAQRLGATATVDTTSGDPVKRIRDLTGGRGVDVAIEAVGVPSTFVMCQDIIAPGGVIANIGVHGTKADLHLERLWSANITITTRLVDTVTTPMLIEALGSGKIDGAALITHHFPAERILDAYETFAHASDSRALKVIIDF